MTDDQEDTAGLYCYRDLLLYPEGKLEKAEYLKGKKVEKSDPNFGLTLYFNHGERDEKQTSLLQFAISAVFDLAKALSQTVEKISPKARPAVVRGITNWLEKNHPIVQFMNNCIEGGQGKNKCVKLVKEAGIKHRRQNALALYDYLKLEQAFNRETERPEEKPRKNTPVPEDDYEEIRDFFRDDFVQDDEFFRVLDYVESELSSTCAPEEMDNPDQNKISPGDFLFEMGELNTGILRYYGHFSGGDWVLWHCNWYNNRGLTKLLRSIEI